jgi:hypothetical protein
LQGAKAPFLAAASIKMRGIEISGGGRSTAAYSIYPTRKPAKQRQYQAAANWPPSFSHPAHDKPATSKTALDNPQLCPGHYKLLS